MDEIIETRTYDCIVENQDGAIMEVIAEFLESLSSQRQHVLLDSFEGHEEFTNWFCASVGYDPRDDELESGSDEDEAS